MPSRDKSPGVKIPALKFCASNIFCVKRVPPVFRECVRNLDLWVQVHPGELWVSKSAGAKGDVPKICGFVHPL